MVSRAYNPLERLFGGIEFWLEEMWLSGYSLRLSSHLVFAPRMRWSKRWLGMGGAIMTEMVNSWPGLVIALVVLGFSGWWLIRDTRKAERKEQERQAELQAVLERMDKVLEQNVAILSRLEARDGSENTTSEE